MRITIGSECQARDGMLAIAFTHAPESSRRTSSHITVRVRAHAPLKIAGHETNNNQPIQQTKAHR